MQSTPNTDAVGQLGTSVNSLPLSSLSVRSGGVGVPASSPVAVRMKWERAGCGAETFDAWQLLL